MSSTAGDAGRSTTSSLAQQLRNVYYARGNDTFEALVKKVEALEALSELRRKTLEQGQQIATLQGELDRCTCQSGPTYRALIGAIGEPCKCPGCLKPITFLAGEPLRTAAVGIPLDMAGIQIGVTTPAMYRNAPRCDCGNQKAGMTFCESSCATQMNRFPPFS